MKFRNDFVTNSSSTNFGAALVDVVAALVATGLFGACKCSGNDDKDQEYDIEMSLSKDSLKADELDEVWVYGKVVGKDEKAGSYTSSLNFSASGEFGKYIKITNCRMDGENMTGKVVGVSPSDLLPDAALKGNVTIEASATVPSGTASGSQSLSVELVPKKPIVFTTDVEKDPKIEVGSEKPITLFARVMKKDTDGNDIVDQEITNTIKIEITDEAVKWTKLGDQEYRDGWAVREVFGINPYGKDIESAKVNPPTEANILLTATINEKDINQKEKLPIAAQPMMAFSPDFKVNVVKDSGQSQDLKIEVINPGATKWDINYKPDNFTEKICTIDEVPLEGNELEKSILKLKITDNDTENTSEQTVKYYSSGKINFTATSKNGEKEPIEDYAEVMLIREGLAVDFGNTRDTILLIDGSPKDDNSEEMPAVEFGLRFIKYDSVNKTFVSDETIAKTVEFSDPEAEDDEASQNVFDAYNESIINIDKTDKIGGGNLPSAIFKISATDLIPGKPGEVYKAAIEASVTYNDKDYSVKIPIHLKPDTTAAKEETDTKEKEYKYCLHTIENWVPKEVKAEKRKQLEDKKESWGAEDLKKFRKECWEVGYNAVMHDKKKADDWAWWMDKAVTTCNVAQFVGDKAFAALMSSFTGPFGAYAAGQLKDSVIDLLVRWQESSKTGWDFFFEYAESRTKGLVGKGIDTTVMKEPADMKSPDKLLGWFVSFFIYKIAWHWYFDMNGKERAGLYEAIKSAGLDIVGVGLKRTMESYIKEAMSEQGLSKFGENFGGSINDAIKSGRKIGEGMSESVGKTVKEGATDAANYAANLTTSLLDWFGEQGGGISAPVGKT